VFFGMAFTIPKDYIGDAERYIDNFYLISKFNSTDYNHLFSDYSKFDEGSKDFYFITSAFLISRITNNYHVLFAFFAIIFAFFYLKSFRFLTKEEKFDTSFIAFLLAAMFTLSNCIFNINGVRFWTAAWIGVYCIFQLFLNNNKRYFILACIIPIVHLSFFIYLLVVFTAYFTQKKSRFWIIMYISSFFISNLSTNILTSIINYFPNILAATALGYMESSALKDMEGTLSLFRFLEHTYINLIILLFIINKAKIKSKGNVFYLYSFLIVWMTFVNFTMSIPSLGSRYMHLALPVIAYIWLVIFKDVKYKYVLYAYPIVYLHTLYILMMYILTVIPRHFYTANPFYLAYKYLLS
jgi:hypothetical protein